MTDIMPCATVVTGAKLPAAVFLCCNKSDNF